MNALRILVVEDEVRLLESTRQGLSEEGFAVEGAESAEAAEKIIAAGPLDLIVLDLQLPGKGGSEMLREMRAGGNHTPVLILTARGTLQDRVAGLDSGGDDYLTKPFAFAELVARVKALGRRRSQTASPILKVGDLEFDTIKRRVRIGEHVVALSPKEKMLLELLMRNAGQVVTRDMIAETVWDSDYKALTNLIEVFVNRLRQKIDPRSDRSLIVTGRGAGCDSPRARDRRPATFRAPAIERARCGAARGNRHHREGNRADEGDWGARNPGRLKPRNRYRAGPARAADRR